MSRDIYQSITDRFIEQLKKGAVPWQQPWTSSVQNIVSRQPYRGINAFTLGMSGYSSPFWLTYKQAADLGGHIRQGEKSSPVIYYKVVEKRDDAGQPVIRENGQPVRIPFVRWANVFNLDQTKGIEAPRMANAQPSTPPLEKAAAILAHAPICPIQYVGFAAVYSPKDDVIRLPAPSTFHSQEEFFQTVYHEAVHCTGHQSRLNREGITQPIKFGSPAYCKEELIAELGASFLSNEAGILNQVQFDNSAAYLNSWIKNLENDPKLIVQAASHAQRGADYVLGMSQKESLHESQTATEEPAVASAQGQEAITQSNPLVHRVAQDAALVTPRKQGMRL